MYRLTVHVENPSFVDKEQVMIGKDFNNKPIMKPKKSRCIVNTLSYKGISSLKQVDKKLSYLRSNYKIARWKEGDKKGKEMIYISYC